MWLGRRVERRLIGSLAGAIVVAGSAAAAAQQNGWDAVVAEARGQTVYFNAWGGDLAINRYLEWAGDRLRAEYDVVLRHVKVTDIAEAVTRILAERAAGRNSDGSVDLLWINGENFAALKSAGLLFGPWVSGLPNAARVDWRGNPTTLVDVTLATGGFELPWGTSALTLFFDTDQIGLPPRNPVTLLQWIEAHPGRFTYPQPPAFLGSAFLKQLLLLLSAEPERLQQAAGDDFAAVTEPLWMWLDRAHASMWRRGRLFPPSGPAQRDLLAVGELDWMLSYNPAEASRAIRQGDLHESIGATHFEGGALANSHFLAIPYNSSATAGARVTANFLLSPEAQARKADEQFWGDPTVLDMDKLGAAERQAFDDLRMGAATPPPAQRFLPEPHPSWTTGLEQAWLERYTR
jgi:putative thiamine transport system substrate-binding protein